MRLIGIQNIFSNKLIQVGFPKHTFTTESSYRIAAFRMPMPGFEWLPIPSLEWYQHIESLTLILAVLFTIGLGTRYVGPLMALLYGYMFVLSQFSFHHHVFCLVIALLILGFSPCADYYSLDKFIFGTKPKQRLAVPVRLLQILVTAIFLFSAVTKLNADWLSGVIFQILYERNFMFGPIAPLLKQYQPWGIMAPFIVGSWIAIGIGLWLPRFRLAAFLLLIVTMLGMDTTMTINTYGYQMIALGVLFFNPDCSKWCLKKG